METFSFCFMVWVFLTQAWRCSSINCLADTSTLWGYLTFSSFGLLGPFWPFGHLCKLTRGGPLTEGGKVATVRTNIFCNLDKYVLTICTNIVYNLYKYTGWLRGGGEVATVSEKKGASCQRRLQHPPTIRAHRHNIKTMQLALLVSEQTTTSKHCTTGKQ